MRWRKRACCKPWTLHSPCRQQAHLPPDPKSLQLSCAALRWTSKLDLKFSILIFLRDTPTVYSTKCLNISMTTASRGSSSLPTQTPFPTVKREQLERSLAQGHLPGAASTPTSTQWPSDTQTAGTGHTSPEPGHPGKDPLHTQLRGVRTSCIYGRETNCPFRTPPALESSKAATVALGRPGRAQVNTGPDRPGPAPLAAVTREVKRQWRVRGTRSPARLTARGSRRPSCSWWTDRWCPWPGQAAGRRHRIDAESGGAAAGPGRAEGQRRRGGSGGRCKHGGGTARPAQRPPRSAPCGPEEQLPAAA